MTWIGYLLWTIAIVLVIVGAWRDATASDKRDREDDALRKLGPMD